MDIIKELSGHSGCCVYLCKEEAAYFVRKISHEISYNTRLQAQCDKQMSFALNGFKIPRVFSFGFENNLFYFDMEYVKGKTLATCFEDLPIDSIFDLIGVYVSKINSRPELLPSETVHRKFSEKISALELDTQNMVNHSPGVIRAFEILKNFDFSFVPETACCGDLTFENILISETKEVFLIDLLDSFVNSWMIDVAKMLQDLELGWSWRKEENEKNREYKKERVRQFLLNKILSMPKGRDKLISIYHILLLNMLRIYPYTHDRETFKFLESSVARTILLIDKIKE